MSSVRDFGRLPGLAVWPIRVVRAYCYTAVNLHHRRLTVPGIRPNPAKEKIRRGQPATCISGLMSSEIVDFLGPLGFDSAWMECEHGPVDWETLGDMTRACDLWGMTSITRCNANDPGLITRTLDRGSMGVVLPHVNTREQAEAAVGSRQVCASGLPWNVWRASILWGARLRPSGQRPNHGYRPHRRSDSAG